MIDALYIGATGMQAQQLQVDTIANNLANVNTAGYKKGKVGFADLMARETARVASSADAGSTPVAALRLGAGVGVAGVSKVFDAGDLKKTDSSFDVAIQGDGFFEVMMADGSRAYTRGGTLKVNRDGFLVTQAGHQIKPGISVPENAQALTITPDGRIQVRQPGQTQMVELGQLELSRFNAPTQLATIGDNLYRATEGSGDAATGRPGEDGMGTVAQGFIEGSNVKMVEEVVSLMLMQRIYELNSRVAQVADELIGMSNNLRRG